jgi:hypothetical protein
MLDAPHWWEADHDNNGSRGNHVQCRTLTFVAGMMTAVALAAGGLSGAAAPAVTVADWSSRQVEQAKAVLAHLTQWPSDKDLAAPVAEADSEAARRCAAEWLRLVLQPAWIPSNSAGRFQAIRRSPAGHDLLVAQYAAADCNFRIWDTSVTLTLEISSPSLRSDVRDWPAFLKSMMGRFLNGAGRHEEKIGLDEFARCTVHRGGDVARLLVGYPIPAVKENNPKRYWGEGNPVFWKQGGRLVIALTKLPDGEHPLHEEYGLKQRFPSVESRLASARLDQLLEPLLAVDPRDPDTVAWGRLAERAILKRPDKLNVVLPLLRSLGRAKGEYAQLMAINTLDVVLRGCRDRRLLETARESLLALRPAVKDPKLQGQIANTLKRLEDLLQAAGSERDPDAESGSQAGESPRSR